jgi:hypothetical protein
MSFDLYKILGSEEESEQEMFTFFDNSYYNDKKNNNKIKNMELLVINDNSLDNQECDKTEEDNCFNLSQEIKNNSSVFKRNFQSKKILPTDLFINKKKYINSPILECNTEDYDEIPFTTHVMKRKNVKDTLLEDIFLEKRSKKDNNEIKEKTECKVIVKNENKKINLIAKEEDNDIKYYENISYDDIKSLYDTLFNKYSYLKKKVRNISELMTKYKSVHDKIENIKNKLPNIIERYLEDIIKSFNFYNNFISLVNNCSLNESIINIEKRIENLKIKFE